MPVNDTGKSSALAWHHNLQDFILGASCSLEVPEMVVTEYKNPDETEETTTSGSSNDVYSSSISMESVRMESRPCSKSATPWSRKE